MVPDDTFNLAEEVRRLRDWRHDVVAPQLQTLMIRTDLIEAGMKRVTEGQAEIKATLAQIAKRDEIEAAVSAGVRAERHRWVVGGSKAVRIAAYGFAAIVGGSSLVTAVHLFLP